MLWNTTSQQPSLQIASADANLFIQTMFPLVACYRCQDITDQLAFTSICCRSKELAFTSIFGPSNHTNTYATLKSKLAGCLLSKLQDLYTAQKFDQCLSQSDLLFIISAGGVIQPFVGTHQGFTVTSQHYYYTGSKHIVATIIEDPPWSSWFDGLVTTKARIATYPSTSS
jgi:hypothetical protein